jgi:hypothetical protein
MVEDPWWAASMRAERSLRTEVVDIGGAASNRGESSTGGPGQRRMLETAKSALAGAKKLKK